jgi:iron complex transport system permease protein
MLVLDLRLPRTLAAFATGGLLAVAGALMQVLLRNPLADPYVLGISGGAAVGALLAMISGLSWPGSPAPPSPGRCCPRFIVFGLAHGTGSWTPTRLLLTGVVVAAGWGAVITFLLAVRPSPELPGMLYWLMGDLAQARGSALPWLARCSLILTLTAAARTQPERAGTGSATGRGARRGRAPTWSGRCTCWPRWSPRWPSPRPARSASSGLIIPHMLRLVIGNDQRLLLPAAALAGGILLTLADTLARIVIAPEQLPVGVITAMLGVPVFLCTCCTGAGHEPALLSTPLLTSGGFGDRRSRARDGMPLDLPVLSRGVLGTARSQRFRQNHTVAHPRGAAPPRAGRVRIDAAGSARTPPAANRATPGAGLPGSSRRLSVHGAGDRIDWPAPFLRTPGTWKRQRTTICALRALRQMDLEELAAPPGPDPVRRRASAARHSPRC